MATSNSLAAILVGGKGTRLQSVVSDVPKPLAPIHGEPFLFYLFKMLAKLQIKNVLLLTGYMHDAIAATCGQGEKWGLNILYSRETEPLGTGGALRHAENILKHYDDFILLNGDTYFDGSIVSLTQQPVNENAPAAIGVTPVTNVEHYGSLTLDSDTHQITFFREKNHAGPGYVNAGIYKLSTTLLSHIPQNCFYSLENDLFPALIAQRIFLKAVMLPGKFHDIGTPESYYDFNARNLAEPI